MAVLGTRMLRKEDPALLTGEAVFTNDMKVPGALHLAVLRSPYAHAKIVSIEDTAEVQVPHPNWLREVVRKAKPGEGDSGVGMFDLLKAALRQRPEEIIIGEIRGEEGLIAFQAMQTGHPVMATFHAASVQNAARWSSVISAAIPVWSPAFCLARIRSVVPSKPASSQMNA